MTILCVLLQLVCIGLIIYDISLRTVKLENGAENNESDSVLEEDDESAKRYIRQIEEIMNYDPYGR